MKTIVHCMTFAIAMLVTCSASYAQNGNVAQGVYGPTASGAGYGQGFTPTSADIFQWMPGRMWVGLNLADEGLGYSGAYATVGYKNHIFEDLLDGRWMFEMRSHVSAESSDPFFNFGIMRTFTLDSAQSDITTGFWFDWDGDKQGTFAHDFAQISGNLSIKTRRGILVANSYHTIGDTDFTLGGDFDDPDGAFLGNLIVLQSGIDSALRGYDLTWQVAPERLGFMNGTLEIGGYRYESDQVPSFLGLHLGVGIQPLNGVICNFEINHDDRFNTTAALQMTYLFGVNARGSEYSYLGQDLDPTIRNDHVLRFQRDFLAVVDPDTGVAYNVVHVSNDASPGGAGTFESPFDTLADAEAASGTDDIIFVWEGDGTSTGYTSGITLKDRQLFLGDGVEHLVPTLGGTFFRLPNNIDGLLPTISGSPNAITLASDNTVRGFTIDNSSGIMANGIFHGGGSTITGGLIEDVTISGAANDGIGIDDIAGDWTFRRITSSGNGRDGIFIDNACDPFSIFVFDTITANVNGRDGIHLEDYDGLRFTFTNITANGNARDGVRMERFKDGSMFNSMLLFDAPAIAGNGGFGININDYEGNARFFDSQVNLNLAGGLRLENVTNNAAGTSTFVGLGATPGTTSNFLRNGLGGGAGIDVLLDEVGGTQNLLIRDSSIGGVTNGVIVLNGGTGVRAVASGAGTTLNMDLLENLQIAHNNSDGIRLIATNGATQNTNIINTTNALIMDGNGAIVGDAIDMLVGNNNGGVEANLNVNVNNVTMNPPIPLSNGVGSSVIRGVSQDDGVLNASIQNVQADTIGGSAVVLNFNNDGAGGINRVFMNNNTFTNITGSGVVANLGTDTNTDLSFNNMSMQPVAASTNLNAGFNINVTGSAAVDTDNRTRININNILIGSNATPFDGNGIRISGNGDAHILMNIANNTIQGAGIGNGQPALFPFLDGIFIESNDAARMDARIVNNLVTGSGDIGLEVHNNGLGDINLLLDNNAFAGNDVGEDPIDDPIINSFQAEIQFVNFGGGGDLCVAMTNNFFTPVGTEIFNFGAPGEFTLELDGLSNSNPINNNAGPITLAAFGSTCEPAIAAQEAAFAGAGF